MTNTFKNPAKNPFKSSLVEILQQQERYKLLKTLKNSTNNQENTSKINKNELMTEKARLKEEMKFLEERKKQVVRKKTSQTNDSFESQRTIKKILHEMSKINTNNANKKI